MLALAPESKKIEIQRSIRWIDNLMHVIAPPAQHLLKKFQGQYGPLSIRVKGEQLELDVDGNKTDLLPISSNTFLDNNEKVKLEFMMDKKPLILKCHFLNGTTQEFSLVEPSLKEHSIFSPVKEKINPSQVAGKKTRAIVNTPIIMPTMKRSLH